MTRENRIFTEESVQDNNIRKYAEYPKQKKDRTSLSRKYQFHVFIRRREGDGS